MLFRRILALLIAVCALALSGSPLEAQPKPVVVNVLLPMTGSAALIGESFKAALNAAEVTINKRGGIHGTQLHFNVLDDGSNPTTAVQLTNGLVAQHVSVILGSGVSATCRSMMPLLEKGPVGYCLTPAIDPPPNSYEFSAGPSAYDVILILYRYAVQRGWKHIATITSTDATGEIIDRATAKIMKLPEFKDATLVAQEKFNPADLSVDAQMTRIKAAKPDVLMLWTTGTPFGTVARAARQIVPDVPAITTAGNTPRILNQFANVLPSRLYEQLPPFMVGVANNEGVRAAGRELIDALKTNAASLDAQSGWAWDAAMIVRAALDARGVNATADQIHSYILGLKSYPGACGVYDFTDGSQRGLGVTDQVIVRWEAAKKDWAAVSELGGKPLPSAE